MATMTAETANDFDFDGIEFQSKLDLPVSHWRWPNFTPDELACRGDGKVRIDENALDMLQALRDRIGKPMIVNSAYRTPSHNRAVGGAARSMHLLARAYDISMDGHDPQEFVAAARAVGFTGIGWYPPKPNGGWNFVHIDTGRRREWGQPWTAPAAPAPSPSASTSWRDRWGRVRAS